MQGVTRPVGELPPEVYWRRRVVAIGLLVLVLLVLFYLLRPVFAGGEDDPQPGVTPAVTPTATPASTVGAPSGSSASGACEDVDVAIEMSASPREFTKGKIPQFTVTFVHTGFEPCVLSVDPKKAELLITSGSDRIWNSKDCPGEDILTERIISLEPDDDVETSVTWPRIRSNSQCAANLPAPRPGTYHAVLTVGDIESNDTVFTLSGGN